MFALMSRHLNAYLSAAVLAGVALLPLAARADEDSEREQLARISHEIQRLQVMVVDASKQAPPYARVRFRYEWLQRDLALIRSGVEDHLDAPRQPRAVPALRGDYRQ